MMQDATHSVVIAYGKDTLPRTARLAFPGRLCTVFPGGGGDLNNGLVAPSSEA